MILGAARIFGSGPCDAAPFADLHRARLAGIPHADHPRGRFDPGRFRDDGLFRDALVHRVFVFPGLRWPLVGWLGLGLIVGLFGGGYSSSATYVERDYDDTNCDTYDNCDNCDN